MKAYRASNSNYVCKDCTFTSNYVADIWNHPIDKHPDNPDNLEHEKSEHLVLRIVAEQNTAIIEELEALKKDMKAAFIELANIVDSKCGAIFNLVLAYDCPIIFYSVVPLTNG